ncbi:FxSxx-COOH system tetratricopeptide repeat protein [Solwaraspora sp. WMMD1047]|uniref:FxSxx-COOH system tetratricopeptide repeat protein n=1 Tax=Solwaraspora sp. WMMD1047 TaxID=3016102 RepID=UPI0024166693|nr:FxSxx-COOH system tetratricopeptide repeat protein [Solwaraspora sp. WMMD1047]MDG4833526.1 FxSxx-COOH system tetratricopeptide repeat protein [Solwaraspora sp. WMMD1047]
MTADPPQARRRPGQIITFYSYKGGTGRTMALANVAWILASNGYRVLAVDWDLESPGLHRFFHPLLADPELHTSDGVIDLVRELAEAAVQHQQTVPNGTPAEPVRPDVRRYAVSLDWRFADGGELDLLPAGRQGPAYSATVSTFDWPSFYDRLGGAAFLTDLRQNLRDSYDIVLIDSRTGLSDSAGICTVMLPDTVVNCFTLSTQSIDGAVAVARSIRNLRVDEPIRVLPVPMRVEEGEKNKLDAGREYAWLRFASLLEHLDPEARARYWAEVEIPYKVYYAYEEILAAFGDRPRQPSTLLAAYERLAGVIGGDLERLAPFDDPVRRYWLSKFERTRPRAMTRVLISYAAEDRMWAEWIAGALSEVGLPAVLRDVAAATEAEPGSDQAGAEADQPGPEAWADADLAAVVLSAAYRVPPEIVAWPQRQLGSAPGQRRSNLLTISVDGTTPPAELAEFGALELSGMSAERARGALLAALNRPTAEPPVGGESPDPPRFPADPPRVFWLPLRNSSFTGRRRLLAAIRDHLSARSGAGSVLALAGLGGVGKTQIATEYAHRFAADYDLVWWISSSQSSMVRAGLVDLADKLRIPKTDTTAERIRLLSEALSQGRPYRRWLLIFDSAGEPADLADVLPGGRGHVLVTSRSPAWASAGELIEVRPFGRRESIELLRLRRPALTVDEADRVAERLGDLPLAIEVAGSWLAATGIPVDRYLALVEHQLSRLLTENPPAGYERAGEVTWLLSLDRLRQESPASARLVELLAFFGPEPIPSSLLYSRAFIAAVAGDDPELRDDANYGRLIAQARKYALVSLDEGQGSLQMHRLVQAVIRESLPSETAESYRDQVHQILVAGYPGSSERPEHWPGFANLWPHLVPSRALRSTDEEVRRLVLEVARYLYLRSDTASSADLLRAALDAWSARWPADDQKILKAKMFLGNALRPEADFNSARRYDEEAYAGLMATVGPRHQDTIMCMSGLAADLWVTMELRRARELTEEALRQSTDLLGADHRQTLRATNNVAVSLEQLGEYREARRLHQTAYDGRRRTLGERFPDTLYSANSLGRVLRLTGDLRGSRRLLETGLAVHRDVHGDSHADTLRTAVELSATLRRLWDLDPAYALARETYAAYEATRSAHSLDRLACANTLALTLSALGNQVEAVRLGRECRDRYREAIGVNHIWSLGVAGNLVAYLRRLGEVDEARQLADEVVDGLDAVVGPDHPYTLQCRIIAAHARFVVGEVEQAREIEGRVFAVMTKRFGETHPDRLVAGCNLISSREELGDTDGLAEFRASLLAVASRALGREHQIVEAIARGEREECEIDPGQV